MTAARRVLSMIDETDVFVPRTIRRAVEAQERGDDLGEGDPLVLLLDRVSTWPSLSERLTITAASGSVI